MTATSLTFPIVADSNGTISSHDACIHVWQCVWQCTGSDDRSADIMVTFALGEWSDILKNHERIDLGELNAWISDIVSR